MSPADIFAQPQRQSAIAIFLIIFRTYRVIVKQIWPFVIVWFIGGSGGNLSTRLSLLVGGIAVVSMIVSILRYYRFTYSVVGDELIVERGVLQRSRVALPLARIQTINIEQNIVHKVFNVIGVKVDTAGSATQEITISAVEARRGALLQQLLLSKRVSDTSSGEYLLPAEAAFPPVAEEVVHSVDLASLLIIGLTQNHIRSGWIIILFIGWILQNLTEAGIEIDEYLPSVAEVLLLGIYLVVAFAVLSLLISIGRTIIQHYGLTFVRVGDGFRLESGLVTRRSVAARDTKIQVLTWSDNLLRKIPGIYDLSIKQAGPQAINIKKSIRVAGIKRRGIAAIQEMLYGTDVSAGLRIEPVNIRWLYRRLFVWSLLSIVGAVVGYIMQETGVIIAVSVVIVYAYLSSFMAYRKLGFACDGEYFSVRRGVWGEQYTLMPVFKLQAVAYHSSPYQRRHGLVTAVLHTAAGTLRVPFVPRDTFVPLMDHCLYIVETDQREWM